MSKRQPSESGSDLRRASSLPLIAALFPLLLPSLVYGCGKPPQAMPLPESRPKESIPIRNVAQEMGLRFELPMQARPMRNVEAFGTGCAFFDFNDDGWQDILLVADARVGLFQNHAGRRFEEVTDAAGLSAIGGDLNGCSVADYDSDGDLDILLTGIARLVLLRNDGGRFTDVTAAAGLHPDNRGQWGASAGWMDLDGDGSLDLVLLNYVIFGPSEPQYCELVPGVKSGCPPSVYKPQHPEVWRNAGGRFEDATKSSGVRNSAGKGLVIAFADVDGNGRPDFYMGNDGTPADLMANLGGMRFRNLGSKTGLAYGEIPGHALAAMGADWADYDRDGRLDLAVSAFSDESYALFRDTGGGIYEHAAGETGISGPTLKPLGFGTKWLDIDNDGWPDLSFANGHVYDRADEIDPLSPYRQPMMLFHNRKGEHGRVFHDIAPEIGGDLAKPIVGRGSATGDIDNDGRIDLLVIDYEGGPLLFHNEMKNSNHWITLDLRSRGKNRFAYGARVTMKAGAQKWVGQVSPASSYLSYSDPRVHFGLGEVRKIDSIAIRWPSGKTTELNSVTADRILRVEE